ncbi:MAG: hypothetical protein DCC58_11385 [Chloroflexi bacterium]|nr:MAG: hypothetical protein DCC58_11385 [Chloroflexota bacterium]
MTGYTPPTGADDPVLIVRTIGRLAQMVLELRDEYVADRRADTLDQLERRLEEIGQLRAQLIELRKGHDTEHATQS